MLFTDAAFLFYFLPLALILHRVAVGRKGTYSNLPRLTLFGLTVLFYGFKEPWWLAPFFVCIGFDFLWASLLTRFQKERTRKVIVTLSVIQNLSLLALFKYWHFFLQNVGAFFPDFAGTLPRFESNGTPLSLPPGISFYTFESLSFVIDVYRRHVTPPKNPLEFFAFIGMFPRFVAGPIIRYKDMVSQFKIYQGMQVEKGLTLFGIGLFLKCCFADSFAVFTNYAFGQGAIDFLSAWMGVFAYAMQIYFDFSGYSLMAIGLGLCLGFQFPPNFNRPYQSHSLSEFWRRWHISLSTWLRDYLYIPLGGSRGSRWKTYRNLFLTMLLGGFWHGASWNFLIWGAWHGTILGLEKATSFPKRVSPRIGFALTFLIVMVGWVFFRADSLAEAAKILLAMLSPWRDISMNPEGLWNNPLALGFCVIGTLHCFLWEGRVSGFFNRIRLPQPARQAGVAGLILIALIVVYSARSVPFLYFQF